MECGHGWAARDVGSALAYQSLIEEGRLQSAECHPQRAVVIEADAADRLAAVDHEAGDRADWLHCLR